MDPLDELEADELDAELMLEDALDDPPPEKAGPEVPGSDEPADELGPESVEFGLELICKLAVNDDKALDPPVEPQLGVLNRPLDETLPSVLDAIKEAF